MTYCFKHFHSSLNVPMRVEYNLIKTLGAVFDGRSFEGCVLPPSLSSRDQITLKTNDGQI